MSTAKPIIFISYSHKDEPEHPRGDEVAWLSELQSYLVPAAQSIFEQWSDKDVDGGGDWESAIKAKLAACDICILLVSRHALASKYVMDVEIETIRERQKADDVNLYPILLSPIPDSALTASLKALNFRPRLDKPLSGYNAHQRGVEISKIADEIVELLTRRVSSRPAPPRAPTIQPAYVHVTSLPETPYERLVGRDEELRRLEDAWSDKKTNIISLVAEGGASKSALVNEWLKRMQDDSYHEAEAVLGWSFYSQGTKERATSADEFLNWALERLGVAVKTQSASAKGEAIAEALMNRRVLLVLDGVEPLQFGLEGELGRLKDEGLRMLLKRFAATPPAQAHGLIVLSSRLEVKDIAGRKYGAAPVIDVEKLSDDAGAELLRDNGVWGTDKELKKASRDFGGHPLALGLLASFLQTAQHGDVRRRDHIRELLRDEKNPGHDHAARVMESYETEWLSKKPQLQAIMFLMGLFDRPADAGCIGALREEPLIAGLTDEIVTLDNATWRQAVARLREARLLVPADLSEPDAIDAHPLVREWFGARLKTINEQSWTAAHGRLFEYLRDATKEGDTPTLAQLTPLYQAIAHGCRAGRHQEALDSVYKDRICKRDADGSLSFYSFYILGAFGSDLAVLSWFFDPPYEAPVHSLRESDRSSLLNQAASGLAAMGRLVEALATLRAALQIVERTKQWFFAAIGATSLSSIALTSGNIVNAVESAEAAIVYADRSLDKSNKVISRATLADAYHANGNLSEAKKLFIDAEQQQSEVQPQYPLLYSIRGYRYCDLLLSRGEYAAVVVRASTILAWQLPSDPLLDRSLVRLVLGRAFFGLAFNSAGTTNPQTLGKARIRFDEAIDGLRASGQSDELPLGLLARSAFSRCIGEWIISSRDFDEVEEIAEPGPMRLFLCDLALERARLAFAQVEAFAPLNGVIENSPPKPEVPSQAKIADLHAEAARQIDIAAKLIEECGYHRRDAELVELQSVLKGERTFASLPIHV